MNATKLQTGMFLVIIALLTLTACGGSGDTSSEPTSPPATEAPAEPSAPTEAPAPTEPPAEPTEEAEPEIPYDVPIMEGAVDLLVRDTGAVSYLMEETMIEDVVEFYEAAMVEQGWENVSSSAIGLMATLVFESDAARVSVSLQANNIAETVNVQLIINEK